MKKYFLVLMFVAICSIALGADTEVQDLDAIVSPAGTDVIYIVDDPGGTPASKKISLADLLAEVNWDAIPWETPSEVDLTGVNWDDYANLADLPEAVNWDEIPLIESTGINWLDVEALQSLSEEMIGDLGSYLTAESDPKVGTLTNLKWCVSDGSQVICATDAPVTTETDPVFGAWDGATGVNWDAFPNAQGYLDSVNWDEIPWNVPTETDLTGVNWDVYLDGGSAETNWAEMPLIMSAGVNWTDLEALAPINNAAVNWADMTDLDTGGAVTWANLGEGELPDSSVLSADIKNGEIVVADTAITAGRSLTWSTNDLVADAETYRYKWRYGMPAPVATDDFNNVDYFYDAVTLLEFRCYSDQTVVVNLQRNDGSAANIFTADVTCDATGGSACASGCDTTLVAAEDNAAATNTLNLVTVSVADTPTYVTMQLFGTNDD